MSERRLCDLLAAYEMGLLEDGERARFENHLPDCAECLEEMYALAPAVNGLHADPGRYAEQARRHLPARSLWSRLASIYRWQPARILVPLAVAAVLALAVILPRSPSSPYPGLALTDVPTYTVLPVRAGGQDTWYPLWESGMESYTTGDYPGAAARLARAVPLLEEAVQGDPDRAPVLDHARFYLGIARLQLGYLPQAAASLQAAADSPLPPVQQKSLWYLAQTRLLQNDPGAAGVLLERLQGSPVFGARARQQLEDIRRAHRDA